MSRGRKAIIGLPVSEKLAVFEMSTLDRQKEREMGLLMRTQILRSYTIIMVPKIYMRKNIFLTFPLRMEIKKKKRKRKYAYTQHNVSTELFPLRGHLRDVCARTLATWLLLSV